ncbi:MAG: metalloprotease PmbA [Gammaproteobacteria bacterium]|jgi:PmbA protein
MSSSVIQENNKSDNQFDTARLRDIVSFMLEEARRHGATAAEAGLSVEAGLSATVRLGEVDTIEHNRDKGLGVTVYVGQRKGSASTTDFSRNAVSETVKAACDIARYTQPDEYAGLPDKADLASNIPDLDLYHPWDISAEHAIALATESEAVARDYDKRITNSEGAYISSHSGQRFYANSLGFMADYLTSRHSNGCTVIASAGEGMERDYWYSVSRRADKLEDVKQVGEKAAQRALQRLDAKHLKTQKLPVVFQAEVARGLLGHLVRAVSGGALYRKASFLLDKLNSPIFPEYVHIDERPHLKQGLGSAPFDNEGVTTRAHDLVQSGVLQSYVLDSYAARRLDMHTTGNAGGVHNLFISHGDQDLPGLLKQMDRGLLITEVMGQGVNIVTGDYSRGAAGFWVENGEIQYPVEEFTLASNLARMYKQLVAVGNDVDTRSSLCTGSWLIEEMMIAGD